MIEGADQIKRHFFVPRLAAQKIAKFLTKRGGKVNFGLL